MRTTWAAGALVTVLMTTALAGCGGGDGSEAADEPGGTSSSTTSTTSPTESPSESAGMEERCPYLTAEQVTEVLGAATEETAGTVNACFFDPESGSGPSVLLSRVDVQIEPADYAHQSRQLCKGEVTDVDVGDVAFACVIGLGPQGQVYAGQVLVTVAVNDAADDATGIAAAAALLHELTIPSTSR